MSTTLRANLVQAGYPYLERAFTDIQRALASFVYLKDSVEYFTYPCGKTKNVVKLSGTIPVVYKANTYNIPVALYLDNKHPYQAPYCYVTPTDEMEIKVSKVVDDQGRIYLPYLSEWKWPSHSLVELLKTMCTKFEKVCPVYAKRSVPPPIPSPPQIRNPLPYPYSDSIIPKPSTYDSNNVPAIPQRMSQSKQDSDFDDTLKTSLITALEEKFRRKINHEFGGVWDEIEVLNSNYEKLKEGYEILQRSLISIDKDQKKLDEFVKECEEKLDEVTRCLTNYKESKNINPCEWVDEALLTTCPLDEQIFRSYVADCALEDIQYYLSQALKKGRISLTEYLKQIRLISQDQFIHRATMIKAKDARIISDI
uniref:Tumor susceptibility gene 101 protein n=1 Tax=Parastrongyloides trichosuri TaxID=131310 RepID=A0A0N4ZJX0_PARTI